MFSSEIQNYFANLNSFQYAVIIFDIVLVAIIFYKFSTLLARTKALPLLGVVLVLLLGNFLTDLLRLETLHWLLTNILTYLAFGIVVVLQPELRHFIAEVPNMFTWIFPRKEIPTKMIAIASKRLASKKIGSILVCLGKIKPYHIIDQGVQSIL